jgi:malonyl-CoA/methylmalonyl-CoA synthetase
MDLRRHFEVHEVYQALSGLGVIKPPTMFFGVPTMYVRLVAEAQKQTEKPHPLRLYVSGSAPLSPQTFEEFQELFGQAILERYGMTETFMNLTNPYKGERRAGTVGMPFPGQEARVVGVVSREVLPDGETGEIEVRGAHVFKGYWNRPEATAEAFSADGWFSTGDLGWRSADGYFTINGRAKELIISGGYNIYPREVEEVLLAHPKIAEVAVVGLPDPDFGEQVVAAIVPRDNSLTAAEVIAFCKDSLASYKKPRQIFFVSHLPRNALTKVQKHLIIESLLEEQKRKL